MSPYYIMSKSSKSSSDTNTSSTHYETMVPPTRRGRSAATATDTDMEDLFADLAQSPGETKTVQAPSFGDAIFDTPLPSTEHIDYMKQIKASQKGKKISGKKTRERSGQKKRHLSEHHSSSSSSSSQPVSLSPSITASTNPIFEDDVEGSLAGTMSSFERPGELQSGEPEMYVHEDWEDTGPYGQAEGLFEDGDEHTYNMGLKVTPGKTNDGKKEGGRKSKKRKGRRRKTRKHKKKHRKRKRKTKRKTKRKKHKRKRKTKRR